MYLGNQSIQMCSRQMSLSELRWFFRIIFHEVSDFIRGTKIGSGSGTTALAKFLSPKADKLLLAGMDLESICIGVYQSRNGGDLSKAVILGQPLRPMLLSRVGFNVADLITVFYFRAHLSLALNLGYQELWSSVLR